jgi:hypothetical protein
LNESANLIKTYAVKLMSQSPIYSLKLVRSLVGGWKHGILYKKIWQKNIKFKSRQNFHKNTRKYIQFLLKFHFQTMVLSIGFVLSWIQNLKNFAIIKVGNK